MATKRFGYLDDLSLKNQKVGIGTSTANEKVEILGGTRGGDAVVLGIATFTSYSGFDSSKYVTTGDVVIDSGESGTLSGEVVIGTGTTLSVGTGATTGQGSIESLKVSNTFNPPIGGINDRPSAPQPGALYYNKDYRTIEYWDGNFWRYVDNTTRSGRGICCGGETSKSEIDYFNIQSKGNALVFGELTAGRGNPGAVSNGTRGIIAGGEPATDLIQYFTIASQGNAIDFGGNLTANRRFVTGCSSSTRGLWMGGSEPTRVNKVEYTEMATTGVNAADFGDLTEAKDSGGGGAWSNGTRGGVMGGATPSDTTIIEVLTIASKGNAKDFGDTIAKKQSVASTSNRVRALGGGGAPNNSNSIQYITMASLGNAEYFGDLTLGRMGANGCSSGTRSVWAGGNDGTNPRVNNMDYVEIASSGNAIDFGDLSYKPQSPAALSDCHGGLGGF